MCDLDDTRREENVEAESGFMFSCQVISLHKKCNWTTETTESPGLAGGGRAHL